MLHGPRGIWRVGLEIHKAHLARDLMGVNVGLLNRRKCVNKIIAARMRQINRQE